MFKHPRGIALGALMLAFSTSSLTAKDQFRTFTAKDGKTVKASIVSLIGDSLKIKATNGRFFHVPVSKFVEDDQEYIKKWCEMQIKIGASTGPEPRIDIDVSAGKRNDNGPYYADHKQTISSSVTIENRELKANFENLKGTLLLFGKGVADSSEYKILHKQQFEFSLLKSQKTTLQGKTIRNTYEKGYSYRDGHKYGGFAFIVQNQHGVVIKKKASSTTLDKVPAKTLLGVSKGQVYDRTFENKLSSSSSSRF